MRSRLRSDNLSSSGLQAKCWHARGLPSPTQLEWKACEQPLRLHSSSSDSLRIPPLACKANADLHLDTQRSQGQSSVGTVRAVRKHFRIPTLLPHKKIADFATLVAVKPGLWSPEISWKDAFSEIPCGSAGPSLKTSVSLQSCI